MGALVHPSGCHVLCVCVRVCAEGDGPSRLLAAELVARVAQHVEPLAAVGSHELVQ